MSDLDDAVAFAESLASDLLDAVEDRTRARAIAVVLEQENAHLRRLVDGLLVWAETQPGFDSTLPLMLGARP